MLPGVALAQSVSLDLGGGGSGSQRKSQSTPSIPAQAGKRAGVPLGTVRRWRGGSSGRISASSAPSTPSSEPPMSTATTVAAGETSTERCMMRG